MRLAVNHAIDRVRINDAACLGFCPPAGVIVPRVMEFALQVEPPAYDPAKTKQLLAEAGYPAGIDGGDFTAIPGFPTVAEAVVNDLNAAGIRVRLRQMERAAFYAAWQEKKLRGLFMAAAIPAMPRAGWRRSSSRRAPMRMAVIRISMNCSAARDGSGIR